MGSMVRAGMSVPVMSAGLRSAGQRGELRRAFLDEAVDALAEVRALREHGHRAVGAAHCLLVGGVEVGEHLVLDERHRGRRAVGRQVAGIGGRGGQHLPRLGDPADQAELLCLVRVDRPAGDQQVHRALGADQARQQPRQAVLARQPAAGERRGELRAARGEPHVAHQRLNQAEPGAGAVDRRDQRLAERVGEGRRGAAGEVQGAAGDSVESLAVHAGAERAAGARQHHRPDPVVAAGLVEQLVEAALEDGVPGVVPVRAVERERGHAVAGDVKQHGTVLVVNRVGHRTPFPACRVASLPVRACPETE